MGKVSSNIGELIATNAIEKEILGYPEELMPYIGKNDKTPIWDGQVFVYNGHQQKKDEFNYKIDIQIKSKNVKKISTGNIKYPVDVVDIRGYEKIKTGTLYFVVEYVDENEYKIYYKNFLPIDIKETLNSLKNDKQKTISCLFKPIVKSSQSSINRICLNFAKNSKKQSEMKIFDVKIEELDIKKVSIPLIDSDKMYKEYLKSSNIDKYMYATLADGNEVVLPKIIKFYEEKNMKLKISVGKKVYYDKYEVLDGGEEESYIKIGKSTIMRLNKNEKKIEYTFKIQGSLDERINDIQFIMDFVKTKEHIVEKCGSIKIPKNVDTRIYKYVGEIEKELKLYKQIESMLKSTDLYKYYEGKELTNDDIKELIMALKYYRNESGNTKIEDINAFKFKFGSKNIYFIYIKEENKYKIVNMFSNLDEIIACSAESDEGRVDTSYYVTLLKDDIINAINFEENVVYNSISSKEMTKGHMEGINDFILQLLLAYDETKKNEFFSLSQKLSKLIYDNYEDPIVKVNYYQVVKRERDFTENELEELYNIKENTDNNLLKVSIAILLENKSDYLIFYKKLKKEEAEEFNKWPINSINNF